MSNTTRDPLAGTRPAFFPEQDAPIDPDRRDRELRAILAEPRSTKTRRAFRLPRLVPVMAVTAAAALAVGVVVVGGESEAPSPNAAQRVLLAAADATESTAAPTPGRFWHIASRHYTRYWEDQYLVTLESGDETWFSSSAEDQSLSMHRTYTKTSEPAGVKPEPADPGGPPWVQRWSDPNVYFLGDERLSLDEVLALPTDPETLKARVLKGLEEHPPPYPQELGSRIVSVGLQLLHHIPATVETRAATYRMIASIDLPGLRVMDESELPDGAVGVAYQMRHTNDQTVDDALVDYQLIMDPSTGQLLENQIVLLENGNEAKALPVGTIVYHVTFESAGWLNTDPVLPPGAEFPPIPE